MLLERDATVSEAVPLFVDVDGTLTRADISLESFVRIARSGMAALAALLLWLAAGRAAAKTMAARHDRIDPALLPYRQEVLGLIETARAAGRPVILASASHWRHIRRIADHLGLSAPIIATRGRANLKGRAKLTAIRERIGPGTPFDYVGDSRADTCLWREARRSWSVGYVPPRSAVERLGDTRAGFARSAIKAMRPHQWAKNALVIVPAFTSGQFIKPAVLLTAVVAALLMSLIASSIYLLNDLLDMDSDRAHRTKWKRPLAHGDLSIPAALGLSLALAGIGLTGGWLLGGPALTLWLLAYMAITTAYSFRLKAVMVGDAIVLASLYTIRLWIGGVAIGVSLSFWLLLFSVFLFLSLAYLKRYVEMRDAIEPDRLLSGRGYVGDDIDVVMMSGVSAGMVAILVLALFAHDPTTAAHYANPELLWLLCLPLIYWMNRIWMMARRGQVEGDPVAFAIKDRRSILIGAAMACIFAAALYGPAAAS
ncbi:UbiA family prenyltransferase [Stakelama sediminis]|uniref:4-hydroxybenzoate polyprenyltransferase/phosphoserine phosphatase n=1 Tax=Stakelama sediminis TaxID=463200 RepID=A0A840YXM9_9SPHN|nr:UbiA family prenyltransferase [Stakelama sediminis]MBB5718428.1 4-hydroxybenzoate polyprenyltransferase/phosphoserine phosphatase [Stakelama sediminis]